MSGWSGRSRSWDKGSVKVKKTTGLTPSVTMRRRVIPAPRSATSRVWTRCCRFQMTGEMLQELCSLKSLLSASVPVPEREFGFLHWIITILIFPQDKCVHWRGSPATVTKDEPSKWQRQQHGSVSVLWITQGKNWPTCFIMLLNLEFYWGAADISPLIHLLHPSPAILVIDFYFKTGLH